MPDIDTFMSVDAGDIDTILGIDSGDIDTVMGVTLVTAPQAYEGQTFLVTGGNTDPYANSGHVEAIQKKTSTSNGDSSAFGDMMTGGIKEHAATGGGGRGIVSAGGNSPLEFSPDNANIHYVTIASDGNATDTSDDVAITQEGNQGAGNGVKMGISGGFDGDQSGSARWIDDMQIYTIAGGSNASDVGDLDYLGGYNVYGGSSSTRWIMAGGRHPDGPQEGYSKAINYMTWSSEGNATDAGELTYGRDHGKCTVSSESRIVFASSSSKQPDNGGFNDIRDHMMEYVNPASTDDAADFGDDVGDDGDDDTNSATRSHGGNVQDGTRGEFWDGEPVSSNADFATDSIRYITIASAGDSTDAGNDTHASGPGRLAHTGLAGN